jgi:hypothetical protein
MMRPCIGSDRIEAQVEMPQDGRGCFVNTQGLIEERQGVWWKGLNIKIAYNVESRLNGLDKLLTCLHKYGRLHRISPLKERKG